MAEAMDNEVVALKRIAFGPLTLGRLPEGEARLLGAAQVAELWKDAERNE
jgi:16S rRNA U516 pseudouridylate synthase RsuA-like enzyme